MLVALACPWCLASVAAEPLALSQRIELPAIQGRLDHLSIDVEGKRLFVAALGANAVEVVDLRAGVRIQHLEPMHKPQGVAFLSRTKRLLVANGASGTVDLLEEGKQVGQAGDLDDADNLRLDASTGQVYIGAASELAVLDPQSMQIVDRFKLSGHPEAFALERTGSRAYINVPTAGQIVVIDRKTGEAAATWHLEDAAQNFAMALDESEHRLFVATRRPPKLLVYDSESGRRVGELPLCGDADDLFFDAERQRVYAICGEGFVDVVQRREGDDYELAERVTTASGARTGLFSPALASLFVAAPSRGGRPAEIRVYRTR
jgi:hypothetical protein